MRMRCYGSIPVFQTGRKGSTPFIRTVKTGDAAVKRGVIFTNRVTGWAYGPGKQTKYGLRKRRP